MKAVESQGGKTANQRLSESTQLISEAERPVISRAIHSHVGAAELLDRSKAEGIHKSAAAFEASNPVFNINAPWNVRFLSAAGAMTSVYILFPAQPFALDRSLSRVTDVNESEGWGFLLLVENSYLLLAPWLL